MNRRDMMRTAAAVFGGGALTGCAQDAKQDPKKDPYPSFPGQGATPARIPEDRVQGRMKITRLETLLVKPRWPWAVTPFNARFHDVRPQAIVLCATPQDVAETISDLLGSGEMGGIHHIVNAGVASRAEWATELFRQLGLVVEIEEVPASTWERASTPPRWGVLEPTPTVSGEPMRSWQTALADYVPVLRRRRAATVR